jgi:hypothetical protein
MSTATLTTVPAATGAPASNITGPFVIPGIPISDRAAYLSQIYIGVTSVLMMLCVITFGTRTYQRMIPVWKVGADDCFIVAGFVRVHSSRNPLPCCSPTHMRFRSSQLPTGQCSYK